MTNAILLSLTLLKTNSFNYGATDEFGAWSKASSRVVRLSYLAQTSGVYAVEYTHTPEGAKNDGITAIGMRWTVLNCGGFTNGSYNMMGPYPAGWPAPRGFYTNSIDAPQTNTISFPIPDMDRAFFRVRLMGPIATK